MKKRQVIKHSSERMNNQVGKRMSNAEHMQGSKQKDKSTTNLDCKHVDMPMNWLDVESFAQNAVVQIFAQVTSFNWLEPYRIEAQYENRGTGFFIDSDGYVVTVAHVVDEAKRIWLNVPALGRV